MCTYAPFLQPLEAIYSLRRSVFSAVIWTCLVCFVWVIATAVSPLAIWTFRVFVSVTASAASSLTETGTADAFAATSLATASEEGAIWTHTADAVTQEASFFSHHHPFFLREMDGPKNSFAA